MARISLLSRLTARTASADLPVSANMVLGAVLLDSSLPQAAVDGVFGRGAYGLVLVVPSEAHLDIVFETLDYLIPNGNCVVGLAEPGDARDAETLINGIAEGRTCVAIATSAAHVPLSFRSLGDLTINVATHDANMVRATMATTMGKRIPSFPQDFAPHPDPLLVCRMIVPGISVSRITSAMVALGKKPEIDHETLPQLSDCVEYGPARNWGLALISDIDAWQAGKLPARDLDTTCLLSGPPGLGKSHFAKILSASMGVQLFRLTAGALFASDGHLGDVVQTLRQTFEQARAATPCVLLLDEIDSFARRDAADGNTYFAKTVTNELLTLVDSAVAECPGLVIIGATNLLGAVEPALLRPGRFSRRIEMPFPGPAGVEHILRVLLRGDLRDTDLTAVSRGATGHTPAELMDAVRSARQYARTIGREIRIEDLEQVFSHTATIDPVLLGRIATHEAGHAIACLLLPDAPLLKSVSVGLRGGALGRASTQPLPGPNTRSTIEARVMVFLAGRAAENVMYGEENQSDGAGGDLEDATRLLCEMHTQLGMAGSLTYFRDPQERLARDISLAETIEEQLQRLMSEVTGLMERYRTHLMALAVELVASGTLTGSEAGVVVSTVEEIERGLNENHPDDNATDKPVTVH